MLHDYGSPCWVSAAKRCRWHVFANGVRKSARKASVACEVPLFDTRRGPARSGTGDNRKLCWARTKATTSLRLHLRSYRTPYGRSPLCLALRTRRRVERMFGHSGGKEKKESGSPFGDPLSFEVTGQNYNFQNQSLGLPFNND